MKPFEKYLPIYQKALDQYEKDHPHWRIEVLVSLIKWSLKSLKHYIEDVQDSEISWESPLVELHYQIDWNWRAEGASSLVPGGHIFGKFTDRNTATKELAAKTLSLTMARQFNATMLADVTNWAWYKKSKNYYLPILPVQFCAELDAIKDKRLRREYFEELVRPFSIGATRVDLSGIPMKPMARATQRIMKRLAESQQRMDINGIRFTGELNERKVDMGLVFEIHPLIADYDKREAYHPVVVGLAVLNSNARFVGNEVVMDTPAGWPRGDREEFWESLLQTVDKLTGMLAPQADRQDSVIVSVNSTLKIPAEHWRPENRSAEIKKVADALAEIGEINDINVKSGENPHHQGVCPVCGWIHDAGFTQIKTNQDGAITLGGILPDIVRAVHRAHEKELAGSSTKDDELLKVCRGYRHPCKAFDDLKHRKDYKILFDTRKRGFISLRGAVGMSRNKSETSPE